MHLWCSFSFQSWHHAVLPRETEGSYTFSDGTSFTLTGGTIGTSDATWSTGFTAWKDGQPKDDAVKQEKQDCVKVSIETELIRKCDRNRYSHLQFSNFPPETQHNAPLDMEVWPLLHTFKVLTIWDELKENPSGRFLTPCLKSITCQVTTSASNSAWDDVDCSNTMPAFACQTTLA